MSAERCFHCDTRVDDNSVAKLTILQQEAHFCCFGCYSIAKLICDQNLTNYYQFRSATASKADKVMPQELKLFDDPELQIDFLLTKSPKPVIKQSAKEHTNVGENKEIDWLNLQQGNQSILLLSDAIHCSACCWLIENAIGRLAGVIKVQVNVSQQTINLEWNQQHLPLSHVLELLHKIGYPSLPYKLETQLLLRDKQNKAWLRRLALAGLGMMQVMMYAVALYIGALDDMVSAHSNFLRWVSFLVATPILLYSAWPLYESAFKSLRQFRLNMDVPLVLALSIAYVASVVATVKSSLVENLANSLQLSTHGEVYFDSITMLVFFIICGRYLEFRARQKIIRQGFVKNKNPSLLIERLTEYGISEQSEKIHYKQIKIGDKIIVKPGASVPFDGRLVSSQAKVDQALLNGEFMPISKKTGDQILAASINTDQPLILQVTHEFDQSYLQTLQQLQQRCLQEKPAYSQLADKVARYFVAGILLVALTTFIYWSNVAPEQALWITISVLVVTCPCALSLATPVAQICAIAALNKSNFFVRGKNFLQNLGQIKHVVFDKTGTLTEGKLALKQLQNFTTLDEYQATDSNKHQLSEQDILAIIAALESRSEHPIAQAFSRFKNTHWQASGIKNTPYSGVSGHVNGRLYTFGKRDFVKSINFPLDQMDSNQLHLVCDGKLLASVSLSDATRPSAVIACKMLTDRGIKLHLLSGDASAQVASLAEQLSIQYWRKGLLPEDKIAYVKTLQKQGSEPVLMVGDGINDAPVMAVSDASVAMPGAADFTLNNADSYLFSGDLSALASAYDHSQRCLRVIKQNLSWALGYNLIVVPFAVMGFIPPYLAAIGMSLSSLLVVVNSLRLKNSFSDSNLDNKQNLSTSQHAHMKQLVQLTGSSSANLSAQAK